MKTIGYSKMQRFAKEAVMRQKGAGFTLIELLVVVAVLAVLISILMPSMQAAKEIARRSVCASNLHAHVTSFLLFAAEHKDNLPITSTYDDSDEVMTTAVLLNLLPKYYAIPVKQISGKAGGNRIEWQPILSMFYCPSTVLSIRTDYGYNGANAQTIWEGGPTGGWEGYPAYDWHHITYFVHCNPGIGAPYATWGGYSDYVPQEIAKVYCKSTNQNPSKALWQDKTWYDWTNNGGDMVDHPGWLLAPPGGSNVGSLGGSVKWKKGGKNEAEMTKNKWVVMRPGPVGMYFWE